MKVREIMSMSPETCVPTDSLATAAQKLWDHDCGCLPVVDRDGRPSAVITDRDICMAAFTRGRPLKDLRVADSMSQSVATCRQDDDLAAAARKMTKHLVRRLPVVGADHKLVGMLSLNDLATAVDPATPDRIGDEAAAEALRVLAAVSHGRSMVPALTGAGSDGTLMER
jgi:CBS domain-containing protein